MIATHQHFLRKMIIITETFGSLFYMCDSAASIIKTSISFFIDSVHF
jgi:hypothetical protein